MNKLNIIKQTIKENNSDGIIFISNHNRYWFTNLSTSSGYLLINSSGKSIFITDSRYLLVAKQKIKGSEILCINSKPGEGLSDLINKACIKLKIKKLLIEKDYLSLSDLDYMPKNITTIPIITSSIRSIKTDDEIKLLQLSADIIVKVVKWVWTWIKPGFTEKEVAKKISIKILELGASGNSFPPIVAAGLNAASPHHQPTDYKIKKGDMVTIDLGCMLNNYASDMTRTFVVGSKCNSDEMVDIYNTVLRSQLKGIDESVVKNTTVEVDKACREIIDSTKYKGLFAHGTGHGVGIQVHEDPRVGTQKPIKLQKNHVITIEPGIYKPNVGGVRIEDTIVILDDKKPLILTKSCTKKLQYIVNK